MFLSPMEYGLTSDKNALEALIAAGANGLQLMYTREELHMDSEPTRPYLEMLATYILYQGTKTSDEKMTKLFKDAWENFDASKMSDDLLRFLADGCKPLQEEKE